MLFSIVLMFLLGAISRSIESILVHAAAVADQYRPCGAIDAIGLCSDSAVHAAQALNDVLCADLLLAGRETAAGFGTVMQSVHFETEIRPVL
jgi:hypothetical protein